jgi:hypothetical protein
MFRTIPRDPSRSDFAPFRYEIPNNFCIFVVYGKAAVGTEFTHFSSVIGPFKFAPGTIVVIAATI